jgi:hypothetical protein
MNFRLLIARDATVGLCPNCGTAGSLERLKSKNRFDSLFSRITRRKNYHCRECKWNGKIFTYRLSINAKKIIVNYIFLLAAIFAVLYLTIYLLKLLGRP